MTESGLKPEEIDLFIPHQANMRIMEATARKLGLPADKVFSNVGRYGNTSAASIPIALCEAIEAGAVNVGDNIVLTSFGAGLSWSALALRWTEEVPERRSAWRPFRQQLETQVAHVRSAIRRQERRVRATLDERLNRELGPVSGWRRDQQVGAVSPLPQEAVEVALAEAVALLRAASPTSRRARA